MIVGRIKPIPDPFPNVTGYAVESVSIGLIRLGRSRPVILIGFCVLDGKFTLPYIHAVFTAGFEFVTPRETFLLDPTSGGEFPFCFSGEALPGPFAICDRVVPRHMDHRILPTLLDVRAWTFGMSPSGAIDATPPFAAEHARADCSGLLAFCEVPVKDE